MSLLGVWDCCFQELGTVLQEPAYGSCALQELRSTRHPAGGGRLAARAAMLRASARQLSSSPASRRYGASTRRQLAGKNDVTIRGFIDCWRRALSGQRPVARLLLTKLDTLHLCGILPTSRQPALPIHTLFVVQQLALRRRKSRSIQP